jgi:alpha-amylase
MKHVFLLLAFLSFSFSSIAQTTHWWNETVFYEIFVRSFYDSDDDGIGDLQGLTQKLDYLNDGDPSTTDDLGIEGIWLMPINNSPSYHGYDVTDYRGINPDYGTMTDFENFLQAAHDRGIKVIVDYVMNHSSNQHPWFTSAVSSTDSPYRDWYRFSQTNPGTTQPWGDGAVWHNSNTGYYYGIFWGGMPDLNYETQAVKDEMFDIAEYWLSDIGVDGFRCDAVKYILEDGDNIENIQATYDFWSDFNTHYKSVKADAMAVGEAWDDTEIVLNYVDGRFDYCFEFDLSYRIIDAINSNQITELKSHVSSIYDSYPYLQWGSFLSNHDIDRIGSTFGESVSKLKLGAGLLLTLPGIPYIYYGEEVGMTGIYPHENIRTPMQWTDGSHAGFTTGSPWRNVNSNYFNNNVEDMQADENSLWSTYRDLIKVRNNSEALQKGNYQTVSSSNGNVYAFLRSSENEDVLVIHNFATSNLNNVTFSLSSSDVAQGSYPTADILGNQNLNEITIESDGGFSSFDIGTSLTARTSYVVRLNTVISAEQELAPIAKIYPNPVNDILYISNVSNTTQITIIDSKGRTLPLNMEVTDAEVSVDLSSLTNGVYFVRMHNNRETRIFKVLKQ